MSASMMLAEHRALSHQLHLTKRAARADEVEEKFVWQPAEQQLFLLYHSSGSDHINTCIIFAPELGYRLMAAENDVFIDFGVVELEEFINPIDRLRALQNQRRATAIEALENPQASGQPYLAGKMLHINRLIRTLKMDIHQTSPADRYTARLDYHLALQEQLASAGDDPVRTELVCLDYDENLLALNGLVSRYGLAELERVAS